MPPSLEAAFPRVSLMPPPPPRTLSIWPAMGAGSFSLRNPLTVLIAERAWSSEIPVFSVMRLMSSSTIFSLPR